ncbi:hypothetical protein C2G38_2156389 [Gigaspora rosea]|uniref:Uncharacterized protein n=1 Tax=Gigaspora rosea TaxID=44941 RepID=A0A397W6U1_9GLOM|nr:hypothetical protein C2G38_2156389 [Gigaspora rosea]
MAFTLDESAGKALSEALYKNTTLTNLNLNNNELGGSAGKALAKLYAKILPGKVLDEAICKNTTLTCLKININGLGESAEKALAEAICKNTTLTNLNLCYIAMSLGNKLDELTRKALAEYQAKKFSY